ncbi:MAG: class I SAM-dependent methyltransferase [Candidatus Nanohaloarchaea archaeon]
MHDNEYIDKELAYNSYTRKAVLQALKELEGLIDEKPRILDLGCGPGGHLEVMEEVFPEASVTCVDISDPHLEKAKEISRSSDLETSFYRQDAENLNLDGKFDLIWCADLLHLPEVDTSTVLQRIEGLMTEKSVIAVFHGNWLNQSILQCDRILEMKLGTARTEKFKSYNKKRFTDTADKLSNSYEEEFIKKFSILEKPERKKTIEHMENILEAYSSIEKEADLSKKEKNRLNDIIDTGIRSYTENCDQYHYSISPIVYAGRLGE